MNDYSAIINQFGLGLDIAGAIILFFYGMPSKFIENPKDQFLVVNETPKETVERIEKENRKINKRSNLGFYLLVAGFLLQLFSSFNYS